MCIVYHSYESRSLAHLPLQFSSPNLLSLRCYSSFALRHKQPWRDTKVLCRFGLPVDQVNLSASSLSRAIQIMSTANLGISSQHKAKSNVTKEIIPLPEPRNEVIIQKLIGQKGKHLRAWEKEAGIKPFDIKVKRNEVHIVGTNEQVEKAKKILNEIVEKENAKYDKAVQLPPGKTGFIMGKDGNTIKQIENETKTTIDVKGNAAHIKGLPENQEKATTKILEILKKSSTSTEGKIKVNLPPNCGLGPIIGRGHYNKEKIAEETDTCVEVIENAIYVSGEPNNCKKAIIKIKSKAADICQRKPLPGQLNFIHAAQKCDYGLNSLDCPNPSWNGEKHYKVYRIDEDNKDELEPEKLDAKGLQEFLLKVLKEIQQEYEGKEEIKADFWCHFGHLYIGNIDQADENNTYDIEQIRTELNRAQDPWKLRFDPAIKELEMKGLEEVLKEMPYTVDPHIRHDFQFYTPDCTSIRAKIFMDMNGNLNSKFSAEDIDVRNHESASPTKYLLCDQFQTRAKVNIMILSEGMDCRLNIRTVSPNNQETKEFENEITKYLDKISVVDKEVELPDDSNMPEDYFLYYWRKCHRRSYQYETNDVKYSVTISEEDVMDVTGSGQRESTKTDIHLHCDEWDKLLTSGKWEPEQIVEKVPQFLEFVRDVQSNVSPSVQKDE